MVQGTMKWTSTSREFGLLTPDDGGRDAFVRFSSAIASQRISDGQGDPQGDGMFLEIWLSPSLGSGLAEPPFPAQSELSPEVPNCPAVPA